MAVYSFRMKLVAPGAFEAPFAKIGSLKHRDSLLEEDDDAPNASDLSSVLDHLKEEKQCVIYWYPETGQSFQSLKGKPANRLVMLYLFMSIKENKDAADAFRYQVTVQGLTVTDVLADPRMGYQMVKLGFTSLTKERK